MIFLHRSDPLLSDGRFSSSSSSPSSRLPRLFLSRRGLISRVVAVNERSFDEPETRRCVAPPRNIERFPILLLCNT